jgi:glycosyltransferase involved in cell wall biosynthesis
VYVDNLARFLAQRGHQVRVLCCDNYPRQRDFQVESILFSDGENEVYDLDFNFPAFTSHPQSRETTFGSLTSAQRQVYLRVFRERIETGIARFAPDVVHVHHGWVLAPHVARLNVPYVITLHGTERLGLEKFADYRKIVLPGLRGARFVMALTEQERQQAIELYGLDAQKVGVVKSGVDTNVFRPRPIDKGRLLQEHGIERGDAPLVFFGGKLTAIKGVDILLRAARVYARSDARPLTLIAGEGDARPELEKLAAELELDGVYFLGQQDRQQMTRLFNAADVAAVPSWSEAFPLTAVEALACGTPVVASSVGGLRELVNAQVGRLVEPGEPAALAESILALLKERFKAQAREKIARYVQQNFSWENTVSEIESVYKQ